MDVMSQALCLVDHATHAGSFRCVPYGRCLYRALSSLFSRGHSIMTHSPSLCTVCFFFSQHPIGSRLSRLIPHTGPPLPSPFFPLLVTRPPAHLPHRAHPLISSPLFPIRSLLQGAHHGRVDPHGMTRLCIPSMRLHFWCVALHLRSLL